MSIRSADLDDSSPEAALPNVKVRYRHGELEPSRSRASRIQEEDAALSFGARAVGVAADYGVKPLGSRVDLQLLQVVEDVKAEAAYVERPGREKSACPASAVVVAANRDDRRDPLSSSSTSGRQTSPAWRMSALPFNAAST